MVKIGTTSNKHSDWSACNIGPKDSRYSLKFLWQPWKFTHTRWRLSRLPWWCKNPT